MTTNTETLTYDHIVALALSHGFKLKPQSDGRMALNDYVIDFARAVYDIGHAAAKAETASMVDDQDAEIARLRAAVAQLRDALLNVKWRPAQESAFIASVNLQDVERRYGVEVDWNSKP